VNVTSDMRAIDWWAGFGRDGDDPQAGGTIVMRNTNRRWEPDYEDGEPLTRVVL
jgi:hypothetical protein